MLRATRTPTPCTPAPAPSPPILSSRGRRGPAPTTAGFWFATGDEVDGPLFTNDTIRISGTPSFYGSVYSAAAGREDEGTGSAEIPCVTDTNNDECSNPPSYRGDEPQPTTSAEAAASKQVGCYITGGTSGGASSAPADVTMSLAISGTSTKVTWTGAGWTYVNNAGTNTNACGSSGNTGSNGGSFVVSNLASGLVYVNGNVNITGASTAAGFLTIVAGDDSGVRRPVVGCHRQRLQRVRHRHEPVVDHRPERRRAHRRLPGRHSQPGQRQRRHRRHHHRLGERGQQHDGVVAKGRRVQQRGPVGRPRARGTSSSTGRSPTLPPT